MSIFNVFTLMGGIAMFLYGMDLLSRPLAANCKASFPK